MDALHSGRVDEDLEGWTRLWRIRNLPWQQLQGDRLAVWDIEVGSDHCLDDGKEGPQDSIMIKTDHIVECILYLVDKLFAGSRPRFHVEVGMGIKTNPEELNQLPRNVDVVAQRPGEIGLAVGNPDLPQVPPDRSQHTDVTPIEVGPHDKRVVTV